MSKRDRAEIREDMRRVLTRLDARWIQAASHEVCGQLTSIVDGTLGDEIENLLCWVPFFPGEIDLSAFIANQLEKRTIYLPRINADRTMTFISIGADWAQSVEQGYRGIPSPRDTTGTYFLGEQSSSSAVIVPGLAFDALGNRLGRGGGYYDRFLARQELQSIIKIGICWSLQVVNHIPTESHDVPVDWVCHERESFVTSE